MSATDPNTPSDSDAHVGCPSVPGSALSVLWSCGLLPSHYDTIEKAAEGVKEMIEWFRADLADPPHDLQCRVLQKLGVHGFTDETPSLSLVSFPACASKEWKPTKGARYELQEIREGHVFAWRVAPSLQSQYLLCIICRKPYHDLFPPNYQSQAAQSAPQDHGN